jgi:hypothetical protein
MSAISHDVPPVIARCTFEKGQQCIVEVVEIELVVDVLSLFVDERVWYLVNFAEKVATKVRIDEKHEHEDEENLEEEGERETQHAEKPHEPLELLDDEQDADIAQDEQKSSPDKVVFRE